MSIIPFVVEEYLYSLKRNRKEVIVELKVWGNCGKCKTRIEKAAKVKGVKKAFWNMETKMLELTYNPKIVSLEKIHEKLALAGHDTENIYAPKIKYVKLPDCCKYIREK
ncbi:MAG: cation transporter [Bacteroidota bacterium]|nr:cation transporter [Bacteroidota bacterium]